MKFLDASYMPPLPDEIARGLEKIPDGLEGWTQEEPTSSVFGLINFIMELGTGDRIKKIRVGQFGYTAILQELAQAPRFNDPGFGPFVSIRIMNWPILLDTNLEPAAFEIDY